MAKSTSSHTLQVVTFTTPLPISTVLARLDTEIAKTASSSPALTAGAESQKELEARVHSVVGPSGFVYFSEIDFGALLQLHTKAAPPRAVVYVIGNPLIAQSILQHSLRAAHNAPLRVLFTETADGVGTEVVYNLPSSVMALDDNEALRVASEGLDRKLEGLVERITAV
ncbi:hypothetical protein B0H14DRAFT_2627431 [Mycena olivaceomarginata]|nr:hypothetical protein B0H14DRAFT_2627431 [Mycena olivaceomarginata]